jgi:hypothetical protein
MASHWAEDVLPDLSRGSPSRAAVEAATAIVATAVFDSIGVDVDVGFGGGVASGALVRRNTTGGVVSVPPLLPRTLTPDLEDGVDASCGAVWNSFVISVSAFLELIEGSLVVRIV